MHQLQQENEMLAVHRDNLQESCDVSNQQAAMAAQQQQSADAELVQLRGLLAAAQSKSEQLETDRTYHMEQAKLLASRVHLLESDVAEQQRSTMQREELIAKLQTSQQQQLTEEQAAAEAYATLKVHSVVQERDVLQRELDRVQERAAWAVQQLHDVKVERGNLEGALVGESLPCVDCSSLIACDSLVTTKDDTDENLSSV